MPRFVDVSDVATAQTVLGLREAGKTIFVEEYRNGVRTDDEIIVAAFNDAEAGGEVRFGKGVTYTTTTDIVLVSVPDGLLVNGQGATIVSSATNTGLSLRGVRYGTTNTTLTAAITTPTQTLTVADTTMTATDDTVWAAGDMIRIYSNAERWSPNYTTSGVSEKQEMGRVADIPDGTTITLDARTWDTYSITGYTVTAQRYIPMRNVTIRDLTIVGQYADDALDCLDLRYFDGLRIENVTVKGGGKIGMKLAEGMNATVVGCRAEDTSSSSNGYGFDAVAVLHVRWIGCHGIRNRHSFEGHTSRDIEASNCSAVGDRSAGFSTHASTDTVRIVNSSTHDCGGGIILRGRTNTVMGCHIHGSRLTADSDSQTYRSGITIGQGASSFDGISGTNLIITGNVIDVSGPTYVAGGEGDYSGITMGIHILDPLLRAVISNNVVRGFPTHGIYAYGDTNTDVDISGNIIDCAGQLGEVLKSGIYLEPYDSNNANVNAGVTIRNNQIINTTASTHSGIRISGGPTDTPASNEITVTANRIDTCQQAPIYLGGTYLTTTGSTLFTPRAGGYFGSSVHIMDNIADTPTVEYDGDYHATRPYVRFPGYGQEAGARMQNGLYYTVSGYSSTAATALDRLACVPLYIPRTVTLDKIGIEVTAASGTGGSQALLGIYADIRDGAGGFPGDLIDGSTGSVATDSIATVFADIDLTLPPGLYWLAMVTQTATCTTRCVVGNVMPVGHNSGGVGRNQYTENSVSGALPSTFGGGAGSQGNGPAILVRVSA